MRLYTRTLVTYSPEPGHTDELVPDLATDLGTPAEDGLSWTFTLREGVRFENGRPITSRDVKYGIERSFASEVIVGGPTYVVDLFDDPGNQYPGPYQDETPDRLGLPSIETPDDLTIVFRLRAPQPDLPFVMALPSSSPVPIEADSGAGYGSDPVSSGPYAITSVDPATGILLDRNPQWDPATDDVRTALPDQVVVRTGLSGVERDQALLAGSADLDITGTGVQAATTARLAEDEDNPVRDRVDDVTTGAVRLLALPTDVAPMDNADCRAAVAAVIDRRAVQTELGGAVNVVRRSELWPRGLHGGPEDRDPRPELAAARASLEACGMPDGFSTVLAVADTPSGVDVADEIAGRTRRGRHRGRGPAAEHEHLLRHRRRQPRQCRGERLRDRARHLDGGLPDAGVLPGAAGRQPQHPHGGQHQLRAAARSGDRRAHRPGARRRWRGRLARGGRGRLGGHGLRTAGRDPHPVARGSAAAQRRGDAAVQRPRPRHAGVQCRR